MQVQVVKFNDTITLVSASKKYLNCGAKGESASVHMEKKVLRMAMAVFVKSFCKFLINKMLERIVKP